MENITIIAGKLNELRLDEETPRWAKILILCLGELVQVVNKQNNILNERINNLEGISEVRGKIIESLQDYNATLKKEL